MPLESDASYQCPVCFETSWVAVDPSGGRRQTFVEDCPVCCRPIVFVAVIGGDGEPSIESAAAE